MATILVVDDSKLSRAISVKALSIAGHTVLEAADGHEGMVLFHEHHPDCVVTDLLMPVMDGHELLHHIRQADSEIPILVLTADIQSSTRTLCGQFGISHFLNKPIHVDELRQCVDEALSKLRGARPCT